MARNSMASAQRRNSTIDSGTEHGRHDDGTSALEFNEIEREAYGGSTNTNAKKKRKKTRIVYMADDGLEAFGEHLGDADVSGISVERVHERFERNIAELSKERHAQERLEQQRKREEERRGRAEECMERQKREVERLRPS